MWVLDADLVHLNHGSFGATPLPVLEEQNRLRRLMEAAPNVFFDRLFPDLLDAARQEVADFVGADTHGFVFTTNASAGMAAVFRSLEPLLGSADEIVTHSHDYNAVRQMVNFTAERTGARVRVARIPYPIHSSEEVRDSVLDAVSDRTKLVVLDHICSATGVVLPIDELVAALEPDIMVLVDGAHGPGQLPLDLTGLAPSWYAGNLHKWVCAPKGAGFLVTREDRTEITVPTVISHAWSQEVLEGRSRYQSLFDWTGTADFTSWLAAPTALRAVGAASEDGWLGVMKRNHELLIQGRDLLVDQLELELAVPDEMVGSMTSLPLWPAEGQPVGDLSPLMFELLDRGFETLVSVWPTWPRQLLRVSAHLYNTLDDFAALASTLTRLPINK